MPKGSLDHRREDARLALLKTCWTMGKNFFGPTFMTTPQAACGKCCIGYFQGFFKKLARRMDKGVPFCGATRQRHVESSQEKVTLEQASEGAVRVCHRIGCGRDILAEGTREGKPKAGSLVIAETSIYLALLCTRC